MEMGDANGNDEVDGDAVLEARLDLVAEGVGVAGRVGDDEEPPLRVDGDRGPRRADTNTGTNSVAAAAKPTTIADAMANPIQPSGGGSTTKAVTSAAAPRTAAIEAKMSATFVLAPHARTGGPGFRLSRTSCATNSPVARANTKTSMQKAIVIMTSASIAPT